MVKLNIGCGYRKREGFTNIDKIEAVKPDIVVDAEKGLPMFKDNSVDYIYCRGFIEHISDIKTLMEEFYRVCKPNATIDFVKIPWFAASGAFQDPTHVRFFTPHTFDYFQRTDSKEENFDYDFKCDFKIIDIKYHYHPSFRFFPFRRILGYMLLNVIQEMDVKLRAIKPLKGTSSKQK